MLLKDLCSLHSSWPYEQRHLEKKAGTFSQFQMFWPLSLVQRGHLISPSTNTLGNMPSDGAGSTAPRNLKSNTEYLNICHDGSDSLLVCPTDCKLPAVFEKAVPPLV